MVSVKKSHIIFLFSTLVIFACTISTVNPEPVPPNATLTPITFSPPTAASLSLTQVISPTLTLVPTQTLTAIPSLTPTPGPPMFTSNTSANCRKGPSPDYPVITGVFKNESVRILGITTPDRVIWWLVEKDNIPCWVWGDLGSTSGNMSGIPMIPAPPIPTPTRNKVDVLFENNTDDDICKMDFYVGIDVVATFSWDKNEFINNGSDKIISLPVGGYDLIEVYNCEPKLVVTLVNIVINKDNDAFPLPLP